MITPEASRLADHPALKTLLRRMEFRFPLGLTDVKCTDLRLGELLSRVPPSYSTTQAKHSRAPARVRTMR
jgi:hypothetical protein